MQPPEGGTATAWKQAVKRDQVHGHSFRIQEFLPPSDPYMPVPVSRGDHIPDSVTGLMQKRRKSRQRPQDADADRQFDYDRDHPKHSAALKNRSNKRPAGGDAVHTNSLSSSLRSLAISSASFRTKVSCSYRSPSLAMCYELLPNRRFRARRSFSSASLRSASVADRSSLAFLSSVSLAVRSSLVFLEILKHFLYPCGQ